MSWKARGPRLPDEEPRSRSPGAQQVGGYGFEPDALERTLRAWVCSPGHSICSPYPGQLRRVTGTQTSVPLPQQPRYALARRSWLWTSEGVPAPKMRALKQHPHPRVAHPCRQTCPARGALFQALRPRPSFPRKLPPEHQPYQQALHPPHPPSPAPLGCKHGIFLSEKIYSFRYKILQTPHQVQGRAVQWTSL